MTEDRTGDQLLHGPDDDDRPRRPTRRWLVAAAVVVLAVGASVWSRQDDDPSGRQQDPSLLSPAPLPSAVVPSPSPEPLVLISTSDVCASTDHRKRVRVLFGVVNLGSVPIEIRDVRPDLPLGGLRLVRSTFGFDSCGTVPGRDGDIRLEPGEALVAHFDLRVLTRDCPQPLPVQASVTATPVTGGPVVTVPVPVLGDLGGLRFRQCPRPGD